MSILLIGDLSSSTYALWREVLTPYLPPGETLILAGECNDKSAIQVALAANPPWGTLATYPNLRFVQSLWAGVLTGCWQTPRSPPTSPPSPGWSIPKWPKPCSKAP